MGSDRQRPVLWGRPAGAGAWRIQGRAEGSESAGWARPGEGSGSGREQPSRCPPGHPQLSRGLGPRCVGCTVGPLVAALLGPCGRADGPLVAALSGPWWPR